jgi:hypothetical protein
MRGRLAWIVFGSFSVITLCACGGGGGGSVGSGLPLAVASPGANSAVKNPIPGSPQPAAPTASPRPSPTPAPGAPTPTPTPGPAAPALAAACAGLSGLTNAADPPACWTPYAATSVWNTPLKNNPTLAANSSAAVSYYFSNFGGQATTDTIGAPYDGAHDFGYPYYFGAATDPLITIACNGYGGNACGAKVHIPANAKAEQGSFPGGDQHITIVDLTTGNEYDLYKWTTSPPYHNGQTVTVNAGNSGNVATGNGFWPCAGATAGCNGLLGGMVTIAELQSGTINHKLSVGFPCTAFSNAVYPENGGSGQPCGAGGASTANTVPIGSVIYWDETPAQVSTRSLPHAAKTILNALHAYGGITTDTNGNNGSLIIYNAPESPTRYTSLGEADIVGAYAAANLPAAFSGHYETGVSAISSADLRTHLHVVATCVVQGGC